MIQISFDLPKEYDLFIAGDFCPNDERVNLSLQIDQKLSDVLSMAQVRVVNLESPVTDESKPIEKTGPAIKSPASSQNLLDQIGVNICNLANNHIMDYGLQGLQDTLHFLDKSGIRNVGVSKIGTEEKIFIHRINTNKIAFISFTENEFSTLEQRGFIATPLDYQLQYQQIRKAREVSDFVVVQYHGGAEMFPYPSPGMKKYAHFLAEVGASIVICHHSHCLSGFEIYNRVPIFYGLGNFYFPEAGNPDAWYLGLTLCIEFGNDLLINCVPMRLNMHAGEHAPSLNLVPWDAINWTELNKTIQSDKLLGDEWIGLCQNNASASLEELFSYPKWFRALLRKGFFGSHWRRKIGLGTLNSLRCETHHEKLLTVIQQYLRQD